MKMACLPMRPYTMLSRRVDAREEAPCKPTSQPSKMPSSSSWRAYRQSAEAYRALCTRRSEGLLLLWTTHMNRQAAACRRAAVPA